MNAGHIPNYGTYATSSGRSLPSPSRFAAEAAPETERGPADGVTLSSTPEAPTPGASQLRKAVANVVSMLAIGGAIATGAAGMVAAPVALVGVTLVSGWMATDSTTPSKLTAWMDKREASAALADQAASPDPAAGNPATLALLD